MKQWLAKSRSPTIVGPLRAAWEAAKAAAVTLDRQGREKEAVAEVQRFQCRLCEVRVIESACGSGNFLYVTAVMGFAVEHMDRAASVSELWALADTGSGTTRS